MARLTRRRLFAAGGAGAAASALAACGASEAGSDRSAAADEQILLEAAIAEASIGSVARRAQERLAGAQARIATVIADASRRRAGELRNLLDDADVEAPAATGGGTSLESLGEAAQEAISAYREGAALLSTVDLRAVMLEHVTQVGAELAAVRDLLGEQPSPFAFVTGGSGEPYEDTDRDPTADA